jgi:AcrR family transcriptional regulator
MPGMASSENGTPERILEGALRALARHGADHFSMVDIGREAGISRRTLYRYFRNRDDVIQAVAVHIGNTYAKAVEEAIAAQPAPEDRLRVVLSATVHYGDYHPAAINVLRLEPGFTLAFIEETLQHYVDVVRDALQPAACSIPAVMSGAVAVGQLAEIVVRLGLSAYFLHSPGTGQLTDAFVGLVTPVPTVVKARRPRPARRPTTSR